MARSRDASLALIIRRPRADRDRYGQATAERMTRESDVGAVPLFQVFIDRCDIHQLLMVEAKLKYAVFDRLLVHGSAALFANASLRAEFLFPKSTIVARIIILRDR